jgi:hypothetical protein
MSCSLYKFSISPLVFLFLLFLPTVLSLPLLLSLPFFLYLLFSAFLSPFIPFLAFPLSLSFSFSPFDYLFSALYSVFSFSLSSLPFFQFLFLPSSSRPFYFFLFLSLRLLLSLPFSPFSVFFSLAFSPSPFSYIPIYLFIQYRFFLSLHCKKIHDFLAFHRNNAVHKMEKLIVGTGTFCPGSQALFRSVLSFINFP